ncbi:MAG: CsgG/HfaB family protein [Bacteroidales bacterium]|jgi:TolB-like protein|nr:CsgG/HfaB family protein [Bacteroidales bacterium]
MKSLKIKFLLVFLLAAFALQAQTSVGVMSFKNNGQPELDYLSGGIADILTTTLAGSSQLSVVERGQLNLVIDELKLGLSGLVDEKSAAEVGKLTGATYMVLGSFMPLGNSMRIDAKVVETATATVVPGAVASAKATSLETIDVAIDELASRLISKLTGENIRAQANGDPSREGVFEFTYNPRVMLVTLIDGKMLQARDGELMASTKLNHGSHLITVEKMKGLFKSEKLLDTTIFIPGGMLTRARMNGGKLEIFGVDPLAKAESIYAEIDYATHESASQPVQSDDMSNVMNQSVNLMLETSERLINAAEKPQPIPQQRPVAKRKSTLLIMSETGLCEIYIDGEERASIGVTPIDGLGRAEIELDAGNYLLKIDGFGVWFEEMISVGNGEIIKIRAEPDEVKILGRALK